MFGIINPGIELRRRIATEHAFVQRTDLPIAPLFFASPSNVAMRHWHVTGTRGGEEIDGLVNRLMNVRRSTRWLFRPGEVDLKIHCHRGRSYTESDWPVPVTYLVEAIAHLFLLAAFQ